MKLASAIGILSFAIGGVAAWGKQGHEAVGYVAMQFLGPKARAFVQEYLQDSDGSLGPAATWADSIKRVHGYTWSSPYHYLDALDNPLQGDCSVDIARDAAKGNTLLNAISNYTVRVRDESLSDQQREEALKFLDHFLGDIGQPLHLEAYEKGGNKIHTICNGKSTELHATWDTGMIEVMLKDTYGSIHDIEPWANDLVAAIQNGIYSASAPGWIACYSTIKPAPRRRSSIDDFEELAPKKTTAPLACPLVWAKESNALCCSVVFSYTEGDDLCTGEYYEKAMPVIKEQVAKQGYRLAAWLNEIFDGSPTAFRDGLTGVLVEQAV